MKHRGVQWTIEEICAFHDALEKREFTSCYGASALRGTKTLFSQNMLLQDKEALRESKALALRHRIERKDNAAAIEYEQTPSTREKYGLAEGGMFFRRQTLRKIAREVYGTKRFKENYFDTLKESMRKHMEQVIIDLEILNKQKHKCMRHYKYSKNVTNRDVHAIISSYKDKK